MNPTTDAIPFSAFGSDDGILVLKLMIASNDFQMDLASPHGLANSFPSFTNPNLKGASSLYVIFVFALKKFAATLPLPLDEVGNRG